MRWNLTATKRDSDSLSFLLQRIEDAAERRSDEATMLNSIYREATLKGIHAQALKLIVKLRKMDSLKAAEFLRSFDAYRHECGLDQSPDLIEDGQELTRQGRQT
jgi:uncharacterized protein (UPF0335 family)